MPAPAAVAPPPPMQGQGSCATTWRRPQTAWTSLRLRGRSCTLASDSSSVRSRVAVTWQRRRNPARTFEPSCMTISSTAREPWRRSARPCASTSRLPGRRQMPCRRTPYPPLHNRTVIGSAMEPRRESSLTMRPQHVPHPENQHGPRTNRRGTKTANCNDHPRCDGGRVNQGRGQTEHEPQ